MRYTSSHAGLIAITRTPSGGSAPRKSRKTLVTNTYGLAVMAVLAGIAFQSFTEPVPTERPAEQQVLYSQVPTVKPGPPPQATPAKPGRALAYLRIPRFGKHWAWTVLEGTSMDVLDAGPGHFQRSALPGSRGNVAIAAHRAGHGDPFIDFEELVVGDEVMLAQNGAEWTYKITLAPKRIAPSEDWIADNMESGHWLTLVTCWPKYGSSERIYVRAKLVGRDT
jgi:LPXTG-site transpeptidase (sortase) family protein